MLSTLAAIATGAKYKSKQNLVLLPPSQVLAKAADALSAGDLVNRKVRQYGSWGLMPFAAAIGSVYPATYMRGNRETYHPMENNWPRCALLPLRVLSVFPGIVVAACTCAEMKCPLPQR